MPFLCCGQKKNAYEVQKVGADGKIQTSYVKDIKNIDRHAANQMVVRVQRSEYEDLLKQYKGDQMWTDETFPPNAKSLGNIENVPQDCEWRRIPQILANPKLIVDGIEPSDVVSGSLGDCYFLSAVSALAEEEKRVKAVFGEQDFNSNGIYKVTLRINGMIQEIVVDDYVPVNKAGKPLFCQPNRDEFWVILLEKAWAKANGSYANISEGTPTEVFKAVTYAPSEIKPVKPSQQNNQLWQDLLRCLQRNNPCCASTTRTNPINLTGAGLKPGHGYTVLSAADMGNQQGIDGRMLKLRNPWGANEWRGRGSEHDSEFWRAIPDSPEKNKLIAGTGEGKDGLFLMSFEDFCENFNEVNLCYMVENPKYEVEQLTVDKKHGNIFGFQVSQQGDYILELHQHSRSHEPSEISRTTLVLAREDTYEFIDGSLKYQEEDNMLDVHLNPGKYYIFAKVDASIESNKMPEDNSISCYSSHLVDMKPLKINSHPQFFNRVFASYGRNNKRKTYNQDKMWISWKLLYEKGGYAYIAFGVDPTSRQQFVVKFNQKDFTDLNYTLKKPYKGKGESTVVVKPGEQKVIVARVKNGPLEPMKFPPPFDIELQNL